jgi:MFS family permease
MTTGRPSEYFGSGIFRNSWWVVAASTVGLIVGEGPINVFAFGVFLKPVAEDLGLTRGTMSSALLASAVMSAFGCPVIGLLVDRWGCRRVMLPGIALFSAAIAGLSQLEGKPSAAFYLLFACAGLCGAAQSPIPYATVISRWFDERRGFALGVAMAGTGLGVAVVPPIAADLISWFGWRTAYLGVAFGIMVLAFVPVAIFVRDPPDGAEAISQGQTCGLTWAQALGHSSRFWWLAVAFFLAVSAINGTLTHLVVLLTDRRISLQMAIVALSSAGVAVVAGRILCGYCVDRFFGPHVAIWFFVSPMIGIALLSSDFSTTGAFFGAILCGIGLGAEIGIMAFFVSRYFGLRAYGKIFGTMTSGFLLGTGVGPYLMGLSFDTWGSYEPAFVGFEFALAAVCGIFFAIAHSGPYPFRVARKREEV